MHSLGAAFIFHGLMNVCIISLSPWQGQKWLPHGWSGKMFLEALLVVLGNPGLVFIIKSPNESCSLILKHQARVHSISLRLADAEPSLSWLGASLESDTNQSKRIICSVDQQLIHRSLVFYSR